MEPSQECPHCYSSIDARATVCPVCRRDIAGSTGPQRATPVEKKKKSGCLYQWKYTPLVVLLLLVAFGALFFCNLSRDSITSSDSAPASRKTKLPPTYTPDPEVAKARWSTVDIRELIKNPDKYKDKELHYRGEVFNIDEDNRGAALQVRVPIPGGSDFDTEAVVIRWKGKTTGVYPGTIIEFWGHGSGSFEGTNAFGGTISQPIIEAKYITNVGTAD